MVIYRPSRGGHAICRRVVREAQRTTHDATLLFDNTEGGGARCLCAIRSTAASQAQLLMSFSRAAGESSGSLPTFLDLLRRFWVVWPLIAHHAGRYNVFRRGQISAECHVQISAGVSISITIPTTRCVAANLETVRDTGQGQDEIEPAP